MKHLSRKLSALTLLLGTGHAVADVFYSGLQDTTIPTTYAGVNIDVDGAGGWDLNAFMGGVYLYNNTAFQPARDGTGGMDAVLNLTSGALIDSSLNFASGTGGSLDHLVGTGATFTAGDEGYLGFKLNGTDYGWMRVVFTNNNTGALIKDWGYNTGGSIAAGNVLQSGSTFTLDSSTQSFALGSAIAGSNNLVKNGANTVTLNANNSFSGTTGINAGTLALGASGSIGNSSTITVAGGATLDVSAVSGGWTLGASQRLTGDGGVVGNATIAGTHNAGTGGVGSQAFTGDLAYAGGSVFEWDLSQSSNITGFDTVSATGTVTADSSAVFHVVLGSGVLADMADPGNPFWNLEPYHEVEWNLSSIFGQALAGSFSGSVTTSADISAYGSFSINGSNLTWTAIPEPTTALAGLLMTAAVLRRRRVPVASVG